MKAMGAHGANNMTSQYAKAAGYSGFLPSIDNSSGQQEFQPVAGEAYQSTLLPQLRDLAQFAMDRPTQGELQNAMAGQAGGHQVGQGGSIEDRLNSVVGDKTLEFLKTQPGFNQQARNLQLNNLYKQGVLESAIGAKNAENAGISQTAVPMAQTKLQGLQQNNSINAMKSQIQAEKARRENQALDLKNQAGANQLRVDSVLSHRDFSTAERINGFQDAVGVLNNKISDPNQFRDKAMEVLRRANLPPEQLQKYIDYIENMRVLKIQGYVANPANQGVPSQGFFGIGGGQPTNPNYNSYMQELQRYQK